MIWMKLLAPYFISLKRRVGAKDPKERARSIFFLILGLLFWGVTFWAFWKVLVYFRGIESFGELLAAKLLSMIFLTFFGLLIFSNVVTALSSCFLSNDLELLLATPVSIVQVYRAKFVETVVASSWMVMLFGAPILLVYGLVFKAGILYYLTVLAALPAFIAIPASMGVALIMLLTNVFPAKRAREVLILIAVLFGVGLYLMFRFLQPERLVNPEAFSGLLNYFAALKAPSHPLLPSHWLTQIILSILLDMPGSPVFHLGMLWSTAGAFWVLGGWWAKATYSEGWSRSQEGRRAKWSKSPVIEKVVGLSIRFFPRNIRILMEKDVKTFLRDSTQWSQLFLLGSLVVVYLYNFSALPIDQSPYGSWYLQNLIAFLNLGLAGFVVAAVAVRFVFPAVSLEGKAFWIIRSSPLTIRQFVWGKFWASLPPLMILSLSLVLVSNWLLDVSTYMMVLSGLSMFLATFGITGLGVGLGALYPRFRVENAAQIPSGFGGMLYMILAIGFIGGVVFLEAVPVHMIFMARFRGLPLYSWQVALMALCFVLVLGLMALAFWLPIKKGIAVLEETEF